MYYLNRILGWAGEVAASETVVLKVEKRDRGIGFKPTTECNYDLKNKKVVNLDTPDDHELDNDLDTITQDLKSAVNKEYLNDKFLKMDKTGNHFDLRQKIIRNTGHYYDGLFSDND